MTSDDVRCCKQGGGCVLAQFEFLLLKDADNHPICSIAAATEYGRLVLTDSSMHMSPLARGQLSFASDVNC